MNERAITMLFAFKKRVKMKNFFVLAPLSLLAFLGSVSSAQGSSELHGLSSNIAKLKDASVSNYDGAKFYLHMLGSTHGTVKSLAGYAEIEPGNEVHPAHKHQDEEFLMIIGGEGTWNLNGVVSPANTGDMLYTAPCDLHGIFNSGTVPLKFVVWRWSSVVGEGLAMVPPAVENSKIDSQSQAAENKELMECE